MSVSSPRIILFEFRRELCDAEFMTRRLGKLLFPHLPHDLQRRKVNTILAVVVVSLLVAGFLAVVAVVSNRVDAR